MITGAHSIIYSTSPEVDRAFLRDVLGLPNVDVEAFVAEMGTRGVATSPVRDEGWGRVTHLTLPSGGRLGVYQPRHARPPPPAMRSS